MLEVAARACGAMRRARHAWPTASPKTLEPLTLFGCRGFDHVTISYCLSMVDEPVAVVRAATAALGPGGTLHIVDFGDMARLPRWFAGAMRAWLARFHVHHRPEVEATLGELAEARGAVVERIEIAGRYALLLRLRLPPA